MLEQFLPLRPRQELLPAQGVWALVEVEAAGVDQPRPVDFFITYLIAVPLGIAKAVRDGTRFDIATRLVVLIGYAIPGFVLGVLLLVMFGGGTFCNGSRCAA